VARWEHNIQPAKGVPEQSAVLLGHLILRGPQTAGEQRKKPERWYRFADISSVEAFLEELRERAEDKGGPLVARLPRAAGAREQRWTHLLCGPVEAAQEPAQGFEAEPAGTDLEQRIAALEAQVQSLRSTVQNLCEQLGLSQPGHTESNDRAKNW
jgi:uncharacterized protein YceH (UPF0502 family)